MRIQGLIFLLVLCKAIVSECIIIILDISYYLLRKNGRRSCHFFQVQASHLTVAAIYVRVEGKQSASRVDWALSLCVPAENWSMLDTLVRSKAARSAAVATRLCRAKYKPVALRPANSIVSGASAAVRDFLAVGHQRGTPANGHYVGELPVRTFITSRRGSCYGWGTAA
jgi:hypothetical protein